MQRASNLLAARDQHDFVTYHPELPFDYDVVQCDQIDKEET